MPSHVKLHTPLLLQKTILMTSENILVLIFLDRVTEDIVQLFVKAVLLIAMSNVLTSYLLDLCSSKTPLWGMSGRVSFWVP